MARVYVSVGSNIERSRNVASCLRALEAEFGTLAVSPIYECPAVGFDGDDFYNLAVGFDTALPVRELQRLLREIEYAHGRARGPAKFAARTLDLDLLLYDELVLHAEGIDVPRAEITRYAFVLKPLTDIAGNRRHPVIGRTFAELWAGFDQTQTPLRAVGPA